MFLIYSNARTMRDDLQFYSDRQDQAQPGPNSSQSIGIEIHCWLREISLLPYGTTQ